MKGKRTDLYCTGSEVGRRKTNIGGVGVDKVVVMKAAAYCCCGGVGGGSSKGEETLVCWRLW